MELFNWYKVKSLEKYLNDPRMNEIKQDIAKFIITVVGDEEDKDFDDESYLGKDFLKNFRTMDKEEKISIILKEGFRRFSFVEKLDYYKKTAKRLNENNYFRLVRDYLEYKDLNDVVEYQKETSIGHWSYNHRCVQLSPFIYKLASIIFPKKEFRFAESDHHTFVVCPDEPNVVYDINWFINGIPQHMIQNLKNYEILNDTFNEMVKRELYCEVE